MAYLRGFINDIFFSYAHGPQSGPSGTKQLQSWVLTFYDHLIDLIDLYLAQAEYGQRVEGWIDRSISRTTPVDQSLKEQVQGSALFVCIMSPHYLNSDYCKGEISTFKDSYADEGDNQGRIYVVNICDTPRKNWPNAIRMVNGSSVPGYEFYENTEIDQKFHAPFGYPEPQPTDKIYKKALEKLAQDIAKKIVSMKRQETLEEPSPPPKIKGKTVFLGFAHDTLEDLRTQVRKRLETSGFTVLPPKETDNPWDKASLDAALSHLPGCDFAMLVVNEYCGNWPRGELAGLVSYQMEAFRAAKKPCRVWVNLPDPAKARTEAYQAYLKTLLANEGAHFADVEAFCRSVTSVQAVSLEQLGATLLSNRSSDLKTYVDFQEAIKTVIGRSGRAIYQAEEGKDRIRLEDLATFMDDSDTLAIVCFDQKFPWARALMTQLRQMSRDKSKQRRHLLVTGPVASTPFTMDARALDFETIDAAELDLAALQQKIAQELALPRA